MVGGQWKITPKAPGAPLIQSIKTDLMYSHSATAQTFIKLPRTPAEVQIAAQLSVVNKKLATDPQDTAWKAGGIEFLGDKDATGALRTVNVGQNNKKPYPAFTNHVVVRIGDKIYDPSYGVVYGTVAAFEAGTIAALGVLEYRPQAGVAGGVPTILVRLPAANALELLEVPQIEE